VKRPHLCEPVIEALIPSEEEISTTVSENEEEVFLASDEEIEEVKPYVRTVGRPRKFYQDNMSDSLKRERFAVIDRAISPFVVSDARLVLAWHIQRLDTDNFTYLQLGKNLVMSKQTLPKTSPVQLTIVKATAQGLANTSCGRVFRMNRQSVGIAKNSDSVVNFSELKLDPRPRDKLWRKRKLLMMFFKEIPTKSEHSHHIKGVLLVVMKLIRNFV